MSGNGTDIGDQGFGLDEAGMLLAIHLLASTARDEGPPARASGTAMPAPEASSGAAPQDVPPPPPPPLALPRSMPEEGIGERGALRTLAPPVLGGASRLGDAGFLAHMDPPTPWVTWATAMWAARLNQNLLHPDTSPVARPLEQLVVDWLTPAFGMDGGHMVPGSSVANLTALWAARELRGVTEVVSSPMAHLSVRKAAAILGLAHRTAPADARHQLDITRLGDVSRSAVVLTAGTVASGAVDPLRRPSRAAWTHVDAAWGGPLRLSDTHAGVLEGVQAADSVAVSAHKWLFQPKESALVMFRESAAAHEAISFEGGYLSVPNVGVLGSHGSSALPLAATLLAWGRRGVAERVDRCMGIARALAERVAAEPSLELFARPRTGVVLWRPRSADPRDVQRRLERSFVSLADVEGELWLRSVAANPLADPDLVVDDVLRAAVM